MTETRSIEECQDLVELWNEGETEEVIAIMGGPPSDKFLADYSDGGPYGRPIEKSPAPKKMKTATRLKLVDEVGTSDTVKAG